MVNNIETPQPVPPSPPTVPPETIKVSHPNRKKWIYGIGGILLLLLVGIGVYIFGFAQTRQPVKVTEQSTPSPLPTSEPKTSEVLESKPGMTLYAENGFTFYYPPYIRLFQGLENSNLWKGVENDPKGYVIRILLIRSSTAPFPELKEGGTFDFINNEYPYEPEKLTILDVSESQVQLGPDTTKMYKITCLGCLSYNIVRFESNNTYYELIAYGVGDDFLPALNKILASFSFYEANGTEWKTYTNAEGKYSVQFSPDSSLFENTYLSADGSRVFEENMITIYPETPVNIDKIFTVRFTPVGSMTLDTFVKEKQGSTVVSKDETKKIMVAGEPALYKIMPGLLPIPTIFVKHNDIIYTIGGTAPEDPILATFKFL